jgi:undecaprenyl diphosphate synthase
MVEVTTSFFFTSDQIALLSDTRRPRHIAIIPDGNRRWAKKQETVYQKGHETGANNLIEIVKAAKELGVKAITFYLFSTENWMRPQEEIAALMWLLQEFLEEQRSVMISHNVRLGTIGNLSALPSDVQKNVEITKNATSHCDAISLVFALNYGGRDDITRAFHRILDDCAQGKLHKEEVTEKVIASYLDTNPWGDPDLLIRTSGEMRVSNFLLWQLSYAEIYIKDMFWPEFRPNDLLDVIIEFQKRERRLGGN